MEDIDVADDSELRAMLAQLQIGADTSPSHVQAPGQKCHVLSPDDELELTSLLFEAELSPEEQENIGISKDVIQEAIELGVLDSDVFTSSCRLDLTSEGETLCVSEVLTDLPFCERLKLAVPAEGVPSRIDWSRLVAVESTEALSEQPDAPEAGTRARRRAPGVCVEVNSGGQVFFGLLKPLAGQKQEEAVVFKFCKHSRFTLQSEQMAAELAWHIEVSAPPSRLILKWQDEVEWKELQNVASPLCEALGDALEQRRTLLVLQFVAGHSMERETLAWEPQYRAPSAHSLGRLLVLDLLLGNADRLPVKSLSWRGNPSNVIWGSLDAVRHVPSASVPCMPIDALVIRRPPKLLIQENDQKVGHLLELALLDAPSACDVLLEAVSCNSAAVSAVEQDWAERQARRARGDTSSSGSLLAVEAFQRGMRTALSLVLREDLCDICPEEGLLEMMVDALRSWLDAFFEDMHRVASVDVKSQTLKIKRLSQQADRSDEVKGNWASWQALMQEKSLGLLQAIADWAKRRDVRAPFSFRGFLGDSMLNPVSDVYELLVRLQQLQARARVMRAAGSATRPRDLAPLPLFMGPATSAGCLHLLRKLGVTHMLNCTPDLLPPPESALGDLKWFRIGLRDTEDQDLASAFEESRQIIDEAVQAGGRALVYCHMGSSRSVTLCLGYTIVREHWRLVDALEFMKSRHPESAPNAGFWRQLLSLEEATLGSKSLSEADLPKGKPQGMICDICGQNVGLTISALEIHKKVKHRIGRPGTSSPPAMSSADTMSS